jgi:hypothetical protein
MNDLVLQLSHGLVWTNLGSGPKLEAKICELDEGTHIIELNIKRDRPSVLAAITVDINVLERAELAAVHAVLLVATLEDPASCNGGTRLVVLDIELL